MLTEANIFHPPFPQKADYSCIWQNLHGSSKGLALSSLISEYNKPILIIVPDQLSVTHLTEELHFFSGKEPLLFPDWETLPYDHFSPHQDIISERLSILYKIPLLQRETIITTISTLMHRLSPRNYFDAHTFL